MESTDKMIDEAIARIHIRINSHCMWAILKINRKLRIPGNGALVLHDDDTVVHVKKEAFGLACMPFHVPMPEPYDYQKAHQLLYGDMVHRLRNNDNNLHILDAKKYAPKWMKRTE